MKAAVFHSASRPVSIEDVTVKDPGPGEVRVALRAAGLCHSDLSVIDGSIPYPTPVVLGHEGAGVVDAIGAGVTSVKEGDVVVLSTLAHCGRCQACEVGRPTECRNAPNPKETKPFTVNGAPAYQFANASAFVEKTVVREQGAIPIDPRVPFECAALIGCGIMTGVGAVVNRAKVETGSTMAVFGLGGIGLSCVQGGVLSGAAKIIAVDVVPEKLKIARRLGATHVIDAGKDDPVKAIKDLTRGGADYTFEAVGNVNVIRQARAYLHSRTLRWSWGAMIGRRHDWGRAVDALPLPDKVRVLAESGFSGLWIDRWGYTGRERSAFAELEKQLGALVGAPFLVSTRGRYAFVSIEPYRQHLEAQLGPKRLARVRHERLADMPILERREGCADETPRSDGWWRACGPAARLEIRNWRPGPLQVTLTARFRAREGRALGVVGPGFEDRVALVQSPVTFERTFMVEGGKVADVALRAAECGAPPCFFVSDLRIVTHRVIDGVPVNDDWGVSARTKH